LLYIYLYFIEDKNIENNPGIGGSKYCYVSPLSSSESLKNSRLENAPSTFGGSSFFIMFLFFFLKGVLPTNLKGFDCPNYGCSVCSINDNCEWCESSQSCVYRVKYHVTSDGKTTKNVFPRNQCSIPSSSTAFISNNTYTSPSRLVCVGSGSGLLDLSGFYLCLLFVLCIII
jgi:hypothetical protein